MKGVIGFTAASVGYAYFPVMVHHIGYYVSSFGMTCAFLYGMTRFQDG